MPLFKKKGPTDPAFYERYDIHEKLGSGGFSEVFSSTRKEDGEKFAAKIIDRKKLRDRSNLALEISILKTIDHPNIVKLIDHIDEKKHIYLILTLITGGELFDRILEVGYYSEKSAANLVHQILSAVNYLHQRQIVHRDLKPENLLMLNKELDSPVVISDFGLSAYVTDEVQMRQACGTPGYVAPEILKRKQYNEKIDCWSTGVIVYILLCGYPPFYGETDAEIYAMIKDGEFEFDSPSWDCISAKDFIVNLIEINPRKRFSASEALSHQWIINELKPEVDISAQVKEKLKAFMAKTRWKKAFNAQKAIHRMQALTNSNSGETASKNGQASKEASVEESS